MNKSKIILLSTLAVLSLTACNKSETESLPEPTATPVATSTPIPTATPIPDNHDFDTEINDFKDENNIEINPDDNGTDIPDTLGSTGNEILYDWLYSNGVTKESVQNDRDSGCKNPYLDGYLEYLDSLVEKAAGTVASADNHMVQPDGAEMTGETMTVSGIEFKLDSTGGAYDQDGYYWSKSDLDSFINGQKELAAMRENLDLPEVKHLTEEDKEKADQAVIDAFKDIYG